LLLSDSGMPIEDIAHLVAHANTKTTEQVYRKELRPVLTKGARARDGIFRDEARSLWLSESKWLNGPGGCGLAGVRMTPRR
jgi:hypothetical protein